MPNFKIDIYPDEYYAGAAVHTQSTDDNQCHSLLDYAALYPTLMLSHVTLRMNTIDFEDDVE